MQFRFRVFNSIYWEDKILRNPVQLLAANLHEFLSRTALVFCCVVLVSGCATLAQTNALEPVDNTGKITLVEETKNTDNQDAKGWWQIGFHRPFESVEEVQWHYDTYIAFNILKPLLEQHDGIDLWRFHRRAAPDKTGHRFSLIFYAKRELAEKIYQHVNDHSLVKQLITGKHIQRLTFYDINGELRSDIGATSDKKWPLELQKTWPYFSMGVSQTWLGLVEYYYNRLELGGDADLSDQLEGFEQVSADVDLVWRQRGSHAFLHHLNALFAYQELYILERRLGRF